MNVLPISLVALQELYAKDGLGTDGMRTLVGAAAVLVVIAIAVWIGTAMTGKSA